MSASEELSTFAARLASFETTQRLPKRRASSTKKKAPTSISWPHETPKPEELAIAGFYYVPNQTHPDNVKCFVCEAQIDGWEPEDNPSTEHVSLAPECGWAINACIRMRNANTDRMEEDPMSEKLIKARRDTFMDRWPHEGKRGWRCKVQKMVEAGWCYDPSPECDDGVICPYCNLSLDGWEPKDNPLEEHRKRSEDCLFFSLVEELAATRKPTKAKRGRASKASAKISRLSTQSALTSFSDAPSLASLGDDIAPTEGDSVITTTSVATTTSTKAKKTRAKAASKPPKRSTRSRANTATSEIPDADNTITDLGSTTIQDLEPITLPKRSARRNTNLATTADADEKESEPSNPPRKGSRTVSRSKKQKASAKRRMSDDEAQLHSELLDSVLKASDETSPKAARGTKRMSNGAQKLDSSIIILEDAPTLGQESKPKAKRGRKPKNSASNVDQPVPENVNSEMHETEVDGSMPKAKPVPKTRKGRAKKASKPAEDDSAVLEPSATGFPALPSASKGTMSQESHLPATIIEQSDIRRSPVPRASDPTTRTQTPSQAKDSPSPQSSDAENKPPSSRPATVRSSLSRRSGERIPLADATPTASPSKRAANRLGGGLQSSLPWEAVDLEAILLASPGTNRMQRQLFDSDAHRDAAILHQDDFQPNMPHKDMARKIKAGLTSPEKKMSVEEWIRHNAQRSEEKLRTECERLVCMFETHGEKAMRSLEGIECAR